MGTCRSFLVFSVAFGSVVAFIGHHECLGEVKEVARLASGANAEKWKLSENGSFVAILPNRPASTGKRELTIYDTRTAKAVFVLEGYPIPLQLSDDGNTVLAQSGKTGRIELWTRSQDDELRLTQLSDEVIDCASLSPDGAVIAYSSSNGTSLRKVDGELRTLIDRRPITYGGIYFSANSMSVAGTFGSEICVCDVKSARIHFSHKLPRLWQAEMSLSRSGEVLAAGVGLNGEPGRTGQSVEIWSVLSKKQIDHFVVPALVRTRPILSPSGKRVAFIGSIDSSDFVIRVYDVGIGNVTIHELKREHIQGLGKVTGFPEIAFPKDDQIVLVCNDGVVRCWKLTDEHQSSLLDRK